MNDKNTNPLPQIKETEAGWEGKGLAQGDTDSAARPTAALLGVLGSAFAPSLPLGNPLPAFLLLLGNSCAYLRPPLGPSSRPH